MKAKHTLAESAVRCRPHSLTTSIRGLLGTCVAVIALCPTISWAKCGLQSFFDIPITISGYSAVAKVQINGVETRMIVSSGTFFSEMTEAAASRLKLYVRPMTDVETVGLTGRTHYRLTKVDRVGFEKSGLSNIDFLVGGDEPGNEAVGVLGRNLLGWADTEYDFPHGMVRVVRPSGDCNDTNLAYWAGAEPVSEVPLRVGQSELLPSIKVDVRINGRNVTAQFATGSLSVLSLDAAKRIGLVSDEKSLKPAGVFNGPGGSEFRTWTVPVETFEIGGERISNSRLRVSEFYTDSVDMVIGLDFFMSHRIYVSRNQKRMYFTYTGGPVFDLTAKVAGDAPSETDTASPKDAAAFAHRAAIYMLRKEYTRALADLDRACELAPEGATYFAQRGRVRVQLKQFPAALSDFNRSLQIDSSASEARLDRARLYKAMDDVKSSQEDLQTLSKAIPLQADMHRDIGLLYMSLRMPAEAVTEYDLWVASHGDEADLHVVLNDRCWGRALANTGLDKALADCNAALDVKPEYAGYLDSRGLVYLRQGKLANALRDYDAALKLKPEIAWSLYGRGIARMRMGERERGKQDLAEAKRIFPTIEAEAKKYGIEPPAQ